MESFIFCVVLVIWFFIKSFNNVLYFISDVFIIFLFFTNIEVHYSNFFLKIRRLQFLPSIKWWCWYKTPCLSQQQWFSRWENKPIIDGKWCSGIEQNYSENCRKSMMFFHNNKFKTQVTWKNAVSAWCCCTATNLKLKLYLKLVNKWRGYVTVLLKRCLIEAQEFLFEVLL